jgi:hypothetical protein
MAGQATLSILGARAVLLTTCYGGFALSSDRRLSFTPRASLPSVQNGRAASRGGRRPSIGAWRSGQCASCLISCSTLAAGRLGSCNEPSPLGSRVPVRPILMGGGKHNVTPIHSVPRPDDPVARCWRSPKLGQNRARPCYRNCYRTLRDAAGKKRTRNAMGLNNAHRSGRSGSAGDGARRYQTN